MKNVLFVLYEDFHSNSAVHVHHFANNLIELGLDCVVSVPYNKQTVSAVGKNFEPLYKVTEYSEISRLNYFFDNRKPPDIVHVWTPREVIRQYCEELRQNYDFKLVIHLEDNEEYILERCLNKSFQELLALAHTLELPNNLSHPLKYRQFMGTADGVTVIMEPLKQFVPTNTPSLTLWPGVNSEEFYPREKNPELFQKFDISPDSLVFCYTGNVHAVNIAEVRSLYLAIALLNREGKPAILIRTGRDFCQFLGEDDHWARQYCRELGYVDRSLLPDILALADVLIQPGRVDKFNNYRFPSKLPEFFAMGKPVILPDTNIALEMEHQKHAWILPLVDALNIIQAVELITKDPELYHQLSQGAVHFAQTRLNWRKNSELLKLFYQEITQGEANILKPLVAKS